VNLIFDIIERINDVYFIACAFFFNCWRNSFYVTSKHNERLIKAILDCFDDYKKIKESERILITFKLCSNNRKSIRKVSYKRIVFEL